MHGLTANASNLIALTAVGVVLSVVVVFFCTWLIGFAKGVLEDIDL